MSEIDVPARESHTLPRCRCVIVHHTGVEDWCGQVVSDPDSPLCQDCDEMHRTGLSLLPSSTFTMRPL